MFNNKHTVAESMILFKEISFYQISRAGDKLVVCSPFRFRQHEQRAEPRLSAALSQRESGLQKLCSK